MKQKEAEFFADMAHSSIKQKRKYTNDPYIIHPRNVAYLVRLVNGTDEMISAAYLHDVLEDVSPKMPKFFGKEVVLNKFGKSIFDLVIWVTDISKPEDGNREKRKEIERKKLADAPAEAQTIKIADLIDNSLTICEYDLDFSKIYLKEKRKLLNVLIKGNHILYDLANDILIRKGY